MVHVCAMGFFSGFTGVYKYYGEGDQLSVIMSYKKARQSRR